MKLLVAGIDLGTSGCRIIVIDSDKKIQFSQSIHYQSADKQTPELWLSSVYTLLEKLPEPLKKQLMALAIDGTSGSILLTDQAGEPSSSVLMYDDLRAVDEAKLIKKVMPEQNGGQGASGSLARLMWLLKNQASSKHRYALHQADYVLGSLANNFRLSDENNALKLGYDVINRCWLTPEIRQLGINPDFLPDVFCAGTVVAKIDKKIANKLGLSASMRLVSGTTDSIAAFIATGANKIGDAVTSLGSTLVVKIIAEQPLFSSEFGIYSHRLGDKWLVGGASNSGGKVLRHFFNQKEIDQMTAKLQPNKITGLNYYPLVSTGERFPIADAEKHAILTPRPEDNVRFFQGILEGIAMIEQAAYGKLAELGAPHVNAVRTVGGGSYNSAWTSIRQQALNVNMIAVEHTDAAYGVALLALRRS